MALQYFFLVMLWNLSSPDHYLYQSECSLCYPEYATPLRFVELSVVELQLVNPFLSVILLLSVILMSMTNLKVATSHCQHHFMKLSFINSILGSMRYHHLSKF